MKNRLPQTRLIAACGFALAAILLAAADAPKPVARDHGPNMQAGLELFKSRVRTTLIQSCVDCHGGKEKKADLDLSTREKLMESGMVDKTAAASTLYRVVAHLDEPHMPFKAAKLPDESIKDIGRWIDLGAPYDRPLLEPGKPAEKPPRVVTDADRQYWAFVPLTQPAVPTVKETGKQAAWAQGPIDRFLLAKMEAAGVQPVPEADRRTLIRRAYFDVIGLPPSPEEVAAFVAAPDFDRAWETIVDKLLENPHFGERWGRHWLDGARFAESTGFEHDYDRKYAYRYRDYVIKAFNEDQPFDEFLRWQLAGDELAPDDADALAATGFLGAGVFPTQITVSEAERLRYDATDDMLATTGNAMLGLTVGCARCHDHKYDPIPTRNYYRMLSAFTTTVRSEVAWDYSPGASNSLGATAAKKPKSKNKPGKKKAIASKSPDAAMKSMIQVTTEGLTPMTHHKADPSIPDFYPKSYYLKRGDVAQKDGEAPLGFLEVLERDPNGDKHWIVPRPPEARSSYRRASLAAWISDADKGAGNLAARVIVNRLWHYHFGRGIVATINDFGIQGDRPTHPELLEWLASDLVAHGWKLKRLHKEILMSRAYRMSGAIDAADVAKDPDNRLWWHRPRRRLEAEAVRDNLLAVSGQLDETMFGPGTLDQLMRRRSIYFTVKRSEMIPMLQAFDWPDTLTSAGVRPVTITPPQALVFLNNPQVHRCAAALAVRLKSAAEKSPADAVDLGYRIACGRLPSARERSEAVTFLASARAAHGNSLDKGLDEFAWVLLSLNEFMYVE